MVFKIYTKVNISPDVPRPSNVLVYTVTLLHNMRNAPAALHTFYSSRRVPITPPRTPLGLFATRPLGLLRGILGGRVSRHELSVGLGLELLLKLLLLVDELRATFRNGLGVGALEGALGGGGRERAEVTGDRRRDKYKWDSRH